MTKTIEDINIMEWFGERKLDFVPAHFHPSSVPLTRESTEWVSEKLVGRYAVRLEYSTIHGLPFFEDINELMLYELTFG